MSKCIKALGRWFFLRVPSTPSTCTPEIKFCFRPEFCNHRCSARNNPCLWTLDTSEHSWDTRYKMNISSRARNHYASHLQILHGFDDTGRLYGPNGQKRVWWPNVTSDIFLEKTRFVSRLYLYTPDVAESFNAERFQMFRTSIHTRNLQRTLSWWKKNSVRKHCWQRRSLGRLSRISFLASTSSVGKRFRIFWRVGTSSQDFHIIKSSLCSSDSPELTAQGDLFI